MKRALPIIVILILVTFLAGCIRTKTVVKERLDQALIRGNRGYIRGTIPPSVKEKEISRTREMIQVEIELPPYEEWERYKTEDKEIWGNKGVVTGKSRIKQELPQETTPIPKETSPLPKRKYTK